MNDFRYSRRDAFAALGGLGLGGALAGLNASPAGAFPVSEPVALGSPKEQLDLYVKMTGSLDEVDCPWWYFGVIVGVTPDGGSRELFRYEGMEIIRFSQDGEGYRQTGSTLTFLRDRESGAYIREWENPYTGKTVAVKPNRLGGSQGMAWQPDGVWWIGMEEMFEKKPFKLNVAQHQDELWVYKDRLYPPMVDPLLSESSFTGASISEALDPDVRRCKARFSSTFIAPFWDWMEMPDGWGAMIWQANGWKLESVDDLPDEYRTRAEAEFPDALSADNL